MLDLTREGLRGAVALSREPRRWGKRLSYITDGAPEQPLLVTPWNMVSSTGHLCNTPRLSRPR